MGLDMNLYRPKIKDLPTTDTTEFYLMKEMIDLVAYSSSVISASNDPSEIKHEDIYQIYIQEEERYETQEEARERIVSNINLTANDPEFKNRLDEALVVLKRLLPDHEGDFDYKFGESIYYWRKDYDLDELMISYLRTPDIDDDNCTYFLISKESMQEILALVQEKLPDHYYDQLKEAYDQTNWEEEILAYQNWY